MTNVSASVGAVLKPAGLENSKGILSAYYQMDVTDPQWDSHPGMQKFRAFMAKYYPEADKSESGPLTGYNLSTALLYVLTRCGNDLTRENVMKIVANMDFEIDTYIPGIRIKTTPTDFYPIEQVQMMRFTGEKWQLFGQSSALSSDFSDEPAMHRARLFRSDRRRRRRPGVAFLAVLHARLELVAGAGEPRA
jgi:hypothetical protein